MSTNLWALGAKRPRYATDLTIKDFLWMSKWNLVSCSLYSLDLVLLSDAAENKFVHFPYDSPSIIWRKLPYSLSACSFPGQIKFPQPFHVGLVVQLSDHPHSSPWACKSLVASFIKWDAQNWTQFFSSTTHTIHYPLDGHWQWQGWTSPPPPWYLCGRKWSHKENHIYWFISGLIQMHVLNHFFIQTPECPLRTDP